jgi:hypothetical protein
VPEVRHLLGLLLWRLASDAALVWAWSQWRRAHQAIARACHYKRRAKQRKIYNCSTSALLT